MTMRFRTSIVISAEEDTHGYYDIAKQISKAIVEFKLPVTVALSGHYGSGKSSIVAMALKELGFFDSDIRTIIEGGDPKVLERQITISGENLGVVFLDAGLWEDNPDLFGTLLLLLAQQFKVEATVKESLKKVFLISLSVFNARVGGMKPGDVKELRELVEDKIDTIIQDAANRLQLKDDVGKIFKRVLEKVREDKNTSQSRLLLILDNLDRVSPEHTMNLLRSIYMYIPKDTPVFILACFDREFIERFLIEKLGITDSTSYLSKYVDFFWGMPLPKWKGVDQVVSKLLKDAPEQCFNEDKNYPKVLEGMLHRAGVTTPKMLEIILRRFNFLLHFYWELKPEPTLKELYEKAKNKTDLLNSDFGVKVAGYFYLSLMYMRWPWLYDAFYLLGESGEGFQNSEDVNRITSKLTRFCGKEKMESDPYATSFLNYYHYMTLWFNPGAHLSRYFRPSGIPEGSIREHIIAELQERATLVDTLY